MSETGERPLAADFVVFAGGKPRRDPNEATKLDWMETECLGLLEIERGRLSFYERDRARLQEVRDEIDKLLDLFNDLRRLRVKPDAALFNRVNLELKKRVGESCVV